MFINFIRFIILIITSIFDTICIYDILRERSYYKSYKKIFRDDARQTDLEQIFNKKIAKRFLYNTLFNVCIRLGGLYFSGIFYNILLRLTFFIDSMCYIIISNKHKDIANQEMSYRGISYKDILDLDIS